jgi:hypothetical protein
MAILRVTPASPILFRRDPDAKGLDLRIRRISRFNGFRLLELADPGSEIARRPVNPRRRDA